MEILIIMKCNEEFFELLSNKMMKETGFELSELFQLFAIEDDSFIGMSFIDSNCSLKRNIVDSLHCYFASPCSNGYVFERNEDNGMYNYSSYIEEGDDILSEVADIIHMYIEE